MTALIIAFGGLVTKILLRETSGQERLAKQYEKRWISADAEVDELRRENNRLIMENARLMSENARLMSDNARLVLELARASANGRRGEDGGSHPFVVSDG
jgi:hypothetical protein